MLNLFTSKALNIVFGPKSWEVKRPQALPIYVQQHNSTIDYDFFYQFIVYYYYDYVKYQITFKLLRYALL